MSLILALPWQQTTNLWHASGSAVALPMSECQVKGHSVAQTTHSPSFTVSC